MRVVAAVVGHQSARVAGRAQRLGEKGEVAVVAGVEDRGLARLDGGGQRPVLVDVAVLPLPHWVVARAVWWVSFTPSVLAACVESVHEAVGVGAGVVDAVDGLVPSVTCTYWASAGPWALSSATTRKKLCHPFWARIGAVADGLTVARLADENVGSAASVAPENAGPTTATT